MWERFQCSSASRKFLNVEERLKRVYHSIDVSVLFSEPKIPQSKIWRIAEDKPTSFSALQRAENSSIVPTKPTALQKTTFQCSSASRKFLNPVPTKYPDLAGLFQCSSASRKFLNVFFMNHALRVKVFQCSSASRKFLNFKQMRWRQLRTAAFQCSSASRKFLNVT